MSEITVNIDNLSPIDFFGVNNQNLKLFKKAFPKLRIFARGSKLKVAGADEDLSNFQEKVQLIMELSRNHGNLTQDHIEQILADVPPEDVNLPGFSDDAIVYGNSGLIVRARTANQRRMVEDSTENDVLFAIGPAGTGKTYTAVAIAVRALKEKEVRKIILTRPAVEAGESLGFLPGDLKEKIDPYLRPLYDALDDMIPVEKLNYFMQNRVIEIAPLAYMRGRTLDNAFIILDEAQNATESQLKMFLTRLGPHAQCIITGDLTQIDLPGKMKSGLYKALDILKDIPGIAIIRMNEKDVIRHKLVAKIIKAYEIADKEREERMKARKDALQSGNPKTNEHD